MFGYCESSRCSFDLWSPSRRNAIDNRSFSSYAKHQTELDNVVNAILAGENVVNIDDNFSASDFEYISNELFKYGILLEDLSIF